MTVKLCREDEVVPGVSFIHYKNKQRYVVSAIPLNPNSYERVVVYFSESENKTYWRSMADFQTSFRKVK